MAKNIVRDRFLAEKDSVIESYMGKADSWAKRVGSGQCGVTLDDIPKFLMVLGLRAVPASFAVCDPEEYNALLVLAKSAVANMQKIDCPVDQLARE